MIERKPGEAFYQDNAYEKFWLYKREDKWSFVYPFRHPNIHLQGYRILCDSFEEALDECQYALSSIK